MIPVANENGQIGAAGKNLRILAGEGRKLPDGGILFKDHLTVRIRIYFKRITLTNPHGAANFFWNDHASQVVDPSYNSSGFHSIDNSSIIIFPDCRRAARQITFGTGRETTPAAV